MCKMKIKTMYLITLHLLQLLSFFSWISSLTYSLSSLLQLPAKALATASLSLSSSPSTSSPPACSIPPPWRILIQSVDASPITQCSPQPFTKVTGRQRRKHQENGRTVTIMPALYTSRLRVCHPRTGIVPPNCLA